MESVIGNSECQSCCLEDLFIYFKIRKYFGLTLSILKEDGIMHHEPFYNETECLHLDLWSTDLIPIISRVFSFLIFSCLITDKGDLF